ncbi:ATP-binding cassette domain-containing protein [Lentilactobacillus otakiensis]|uniref:ABC transporter ATP-binding protein n=1 Tax=Lentilactobacillus otakiensis TaxID=481720 RepID=UPI001CBCA1BE|nr:ATP-binding cassette domain-containing protein [Lentilactobacillus otakiensis]MBZ3776943.1 ATP-binding cassette domain-containing protein [Lentilactobacillus otakiensis]MDV3517863.1 ATP-binding cassette domain-containing protein [Lentilactobacillus otakiensis]
MKILSVSNLNQSFGSRHVLNDISFDIKSGTIVGLVGPNGAGKSTIMKDILGLLDYQSGTITVAGTNTSFQDHRPLKQVGALIEYPGLYPFLTGWDNLKLFATSTANVEKVVSELHMNSYIKKRAGHYSLGMKQKLGIALALVNEPDLVILDEPMNGLDPQSVKDLRDLIKQMAGNGTTFLISSHILSELEKLADDLIVIKQGRIIQHTSMKEMLNRDSHFIILKTSDDRAANSLVVNAGYQVTASQPLTIIESESDEVAKILSLLSENNIEVIDFQHNEGNLEHSLLTVLAEEKV